MTSPPARARDRLAPAAFVALLAAWWLMYFLVAAWTPYQGDDWTRLAWLHHHPGAGLGALADYARQHPSTGEVLGLLAVTWRPFYLLVAPTTIVLLVIGLYRLAFRRLPDPRGGRDVLHLALLHTLVWLGAPRVGVTLGHRPHVLHFVVGLTALIWLMGWLRRAPGGGAGRVALAAGLGLVGGASNHHVALLSLALTLAAIGGRLRRRTAPPAWMWAAAAALAVGLVLLFKNPQPYFAALGRRGFSSTFGQILQFLIEGGELIALCTLTAFGALVRSRVMTVTMPTPSAAELRWMAGCFFAAFALVIVATAGPRWGEPALFAPSVVFVAGGIVALARLADDAWVRRFVLLLTIAVHVIVAAILLPTYREAAAEGARRLAQLRAAPPDSIATITPYRHVELTFWFLGEDLGWATTRELAAIEVFGLRDLRFDRQTGVFEPSSGLELRLAITTAPPTPPAELARIAGPRIATNLGVARDQLRRITRELGADRTVVSAAIEVTNLDFPGRAGRPIYAAKVESGRGNVYPQAMWHQPDPLQRMSFDVYWRSLKGSYDERYVLGLNLSLPVTVGRHGWLQFVPTWAGSYTLVLCNPTECLAVETAWVRY